MAPLFPDVPDRMKKMPDTKARMVRWGRMCPMLLMTKAVKTKSNETMGKGVAVRTISAGARDSWRLSRETAGGGIFTVDLESAGEGGAY